MTKTDPWIDDKLGYRAIGKAFTDLVRSTTGTNVIAIEAGFGRGKTFFQERWAQQLSETETVVQIDLLKSDHTGDPVVTFLGALIEKLGPQEKSRWVSAIAKGRKLVWGGAKIGAAVVARKAGEELSNTIEEYLASDGNVSKLNEAISDFSKGASKALTEQVVAQMSAERVRLREMPERMNELRLALTDNNPEKKVVVLIGELDRCHPDYALLLLESMKMAFAEPGFVFVLMVDDQYLNGIARHRFGVEFSGEDYLEKFIDLRLTLRADPKRQAEAAAEYLVTELPEYVSVADDLEFGLDRAAEVARKSVSSASLTMRQIKRTIERVKLVLLVYKGRPVDVPLLVYLAFSKTIGHKIADVMPRVELNDVLRADFEKRRQRYGDSRENQGRVAQEAQSLIGEKFPELLRLPDQIYKSPDPGSGHRWPSWVKVIHHLSRHYVQEHEQLLDAVLRWQSPEQSDRN